MKTWWRRLSLRVKLALGNASAAAAAGLVWLPMIAGWGKPETARDFDGALVLGLAIILFFGAASYFIAARALAPVGEIADRMRKLSAGATGQRLPAGESRDELGRLTAGFNQALRQLEESFSQLDRLTADVSHELRTPLTAMRAVGEVALQDPNPAILHDAVGSMLEEIRRMNQLIERLLLLTRPGNEEMPVKLEAGLVRTILLEVSDSLSLVAEEKRQWLELDCPDHLLAVFDPALLRLALMNLAQNAIRYSPPGKAIRMRALAGKGVVMVEVADEGPGIAPEHQQKIFERFYRVDKARSRAEGGVGLGLAIVKWSVERMGGSVELASEPGRGSVFTLRLRTIQN
jgi:signal transduction histidine kinase